MKKYFEKTYKDGFESFINVLEQKIDNEEKTFVVTANPETFMTGQKISDFDKLLKSDGTIIVPDGIGIIKASNALGMPIKERVPGVEIVERLFRLLNEKKRSLYLLGAQKVVLEKLLLRIRDEYPGIQVLGACDGYVKDKDTEMEKIAELKPDVVLVALGIPMQERLIYRHYDEFSKGILMGVGGSFDVLSGTKKRAPKIFLKLNLEWLYRLMKEPKRLKRFYDNNIKFIAKVNKMR